MAAYLNEQGIASDPDELAAEEWYDAAEALPTVAEPVEVAAAPDAPSTDWHAEADRFTVVGNHLAQHRELTLTAIGLAVHIQSLPEGARVDIKTLAAHFPDSQSPVHTCVGFCGLAAVPVIINPFAPGP